ncbi:uncharacterized protein LOC110696377 isoform X3 [Chenopodium quinoa]|uniref:uncharacterized protein LOC110696377 isoform X3 n=1 Tax=Chenopodium quinoa TaxID=63459 RepID=UPI000B77951A|nr:uncharacterized protein LOC110696377 isoform X3 [Chenopodium quinoa]
MANPRNQRYCHTVLEKGSEAEFFEELGPKAMVASEDHVEIMQKFVQLMGLLLCWCSASVLACCSLYALLLLLFCTSATM